LLLEPGKILQDTSDIVKGAVFGIEKLKGHGIESMERYWMSGEPEPNVTAISLSVVSTGATRKVREIPHPNRFVHQ
jgi:hypothetical protein